MFRNYDPDKYDPSPSFALPPEGRHVLRVESAEWATSKKGNEMIKMVLSVEGHPGKVFHYFPDNEYLQEKLDPFFSSFGIDPREYNRPDGWRGRSGEAVVRHEEHDGRKGAKVWYFVTGPERQTQPGPQGDAAGDAHGEAFGDDCPLDMPGFGDDYPLDTADFGGDGAADVPF